MSGGDQFPDRYFPRRYFPERYFQGGDQNPGSMSASLSGSSSLIGVIGYVDNSQPVVSSFASTGGGGAANRWYRGKYRGELRRSIRRALGELSGVTDRRKRKKIARKVAETIRPALDFWPVFPAAVKAELEPLELIRIKLVRIAYEIKATEAKVMAEDKALAQRLADALQEYEDRVKKVERQQEEEIIVATLLLAA